MSLLTSRHKNLRNTPPIVNAVTKAWIKDRYIPVVPVIIHVTLIDEREEK